MAKLNFFYRSVFGSDLDMSTFESRIKLQKLVYIIKSLGVEFGYDFTWYIYGPYSPDLTHDGYLFTRNRNQISELPGSVLMSREEQSILPKINRKILNNSDNAELIASYLYLKDKYGPRAQDELRIRKPRYSISTIEHVIGEWNKTLITD